MEDVVHPPVLQEQRHKEQSCTKVPAPARDLLMRKVGVVIYILREVGVLWFYGCMGHSFNKSHAVLVILYI